MPIRYWQTAFKLLNAHALSINPCIPAKGIRHSLPTFTAGSSPFWIILRTCWRVVRRKLAASLTVRISFMPMGRAFCRNGRCFGLCYDRAALCRCSCAACVPAPCGSPSCRIDPPAGRSGTFPHRIEASACPSQTGGRLHQWCKSPSCSCNQ